MEWDSLKRDIAKALAEALTNVLPIIGGKDWWENYVLNELTPAQRAQVQKLTQPDLFQLDMAAILRLFDRNWSELAFKQNYQRDGRTLVKELMAVRNRWAHEPITGHELEDLYRDLDTAKRFLTLLSAPDELISRVNEYRLSVLSRVADASNSANTVPKPADSSMEDKPTEAGSNTGTDLVVIGAGSINDRETSKFSKILKNKAYIGIDFGTSTTVASYIKLDDEGTHVIVEPIEIKQKFADGRTSRYHLVPSCIALNPADGEVLFGIGAKELQYRLREGIDVWSSFKMELGVDLGPKYRNTKLKSGIRDIVIEKPQDAAREFFKFLKEGIAEFIERKELPRSIALAVSVPASFEANQRRDLVKVLIQAGFNLDESCLIDEPNAAFLSFLHASWIEGGAFVDFLRSESRNILVFDFGAGTCDISVLRISVVANSVRSKNLSISRFIALGGNNIDRAIAEEILLPQMITQSSLPDLGVTSEQTEQIVIPRLMPVAERLKIQCSNMLAQRGMSLVDDCITATERVTDHSIPDLVIGDKTLKLKGPTITVSEFAKIMEKFISIPEESDTEDAVSIFVPIQSALSKANLSNDRLNSLIFIGGSSENPLIQGAIKNYFGRFVDALVPRDLRTHVSQGAAFHAFAHHAFKTDIIKPIISEPIMLVTSSGGLNPILEAGTEVPTPSPFISPPFQILHNEQQKIELPICVTSEEKILSVLSISPIQGGHFKKGQTVTLTCRMTSDKLLEITVDVDNKQTIVEQLNPLANTALTENETRFLIAKQRFNKAVLKGNGRPAIGEVISYARAAAEASRNLHAAELYEQIELMNQAKNFAVNICYNYDRANRSELAEKWANIAYNREKNSTTAFNLAIFMQRNHKIADARSFLEESIKHDPDYAAAILLLGEILEKENQSGYDHFEKVIKLLRDELDQGSISENDCRRLVRVARQVGDTQLAAQAEIVVKKMGRGRFLYNEEYLLGAHGDKEMISQR